MVANILQKTPETANITGETRNWRDVFAQCSPASQVAHQHSLERGLYVHIPFCAAKCSYCDFASFTTNEPQIERYIKALAREIESVAFHTAHEVFTSVYLGGGTPTYLGKDRLAELVRLIENSFTLSSDVEWTCEANPESAAAETLKAARQFGVNRISLGVQSFDPEELQILGRIHDAVEPVRAVRDARWAGFDNLSLDLIFGLPRQKPERWRQTLETVLELEPDHLSTYSLILEGGTPLESAVKAGRIPEPDEDRFLMMDQMTSEMLSRAGFERYEISNWCRNGRRSRHNQLYWRQNPWLGLGLSAHSFWCGRRFHHSRQLTAYTSAWLSPQWNASQYADLCCLEVIDEAREAEDAMIFGLRMRDGIDLDGYHKRYGFDPMIRWEKEISTALHRGWLVLEGRRLVMTEKTIPISNELLLMFISSPTVSNANEVGLDAG